MLQKFLKRFVRKFIYRDPKNTRNKYIENWLLSLKPGSEILDAGAGIMRYKKFCTHLNYKSQDFGEYKGGEIFIGKKIDNWDAMKCDLICDITNIPVSDKSFDYILCSEVFEHLLNPDDALKELARILK